jgi:hypothetical protein
MYTHIAFNIFFALLAAHALREYEYPSPMWWFSLVIVVVNSLTTLDYALNL